MKRDTLRDFEKAVLVEALKAGKSWEEAKGLLPDIEPEVLERGFKEWAHKEAELELQHEAAATGAGTEPAATAVEPGGEEPQADEPQAQPRRRGRASKQPKTAE